MKLVCPVSSECIDTWSPPGEKLISVCGCNSSQVLVASGSILFYIEISKEGKTVVDIS